MAKILIIEDDRFLRELIARKLKNEGYEIAEAVDGEEGLKKIKEEKPDLVLLDLILPGIDGFEVLTRAKEDPVIAQIPEDKLVQKSIDERRPLIYSYPNSKAAIEILNLALKLVGSNYRIQQSFLDRVFSWIRF